MSYLIFVSSCNHPSLPESATIICTPEEFPEVKKSLNLLYSEIQCWKMYKDG